MYVSTLTLASELFTPFSAPIPSLKCSLEGDCPFLFTQRKSILDNNSWNLDKTWTQNTEIKVGCSFYLNHRFLDLLFEGDPFDLGLSVIKFHLVIFYWEDFCACLCGTFALSLFLMLQWEGNVLGEKWSISAQLHTLGIAAGWLFLASGVISLQAWVFVVADAWSAWGWLLGVFFYYFLCWFSLCYPDLIKQRDRTEMTEWAPRGSPPAWGVCRGLSIVLFHFLAYSVNSSTKN